MTNDQDGFIPASGKMLVKEFKDEETERVLDSGIVLVKQGPDQAAAAGLVVATHTEDNEYLGKKVVFSPYSGFSMHVNHVVYRLLSDHDVLGTFTNEEVEFGVR